MLKILGRFIIILLAAGAVTAALFAITGQSSAAPAVPGEQQGHPPAGFLPGLAPDGQTGSLHVPGGRGEGRGFGRGLGRGEGSEQVSLAAGFPGIARSLGVIAVITALVAGIQALARRFTRRTQPQPPAAEPGPSAG